MTRPQLRTEAERGTRDRLAMELQALPGRSTRELEEGLAKADPSAPAQQSQS